MFLALREMRRAVVRFTLLAIAIALLVFLILTQQALQDGLVTSFIGGIRNQSAPVLVYSVDGQRTLQGSIVTPELEQAVLATDGISDAARINQGTFTVRVGDGDSSDAAIVGTDDPALGVPDELASGRRPERPAEAVGSAVDFAVGDEVTVVPSSGGSPTVVTVVGLADDVQISVTPTLFTDRATYESAVASRSPTVERVLPNAIAVRPADGVSAEEIVDRLAEASPEADPLTREQAADEAPGVAQVRQSFQVIFLLYGLVIPLVTGLFFLILTLQKRSALVLLRAMGATSSVLVRALLVQVLIVVCAGLAIGVALYTPLSRARIGTLALRFDLTAVVAWSIVLVVLGSVSALVSVRRVVRIDPIEATTGGGLR